MEGEDFNPSQSPFDPELMMLSGDGRKHDHVAIGDGLIRCPRSLSKIKKQQTKSLTEMGPRPQPVDLAIELRAHELLAEANRQAKERETELEQRTARMLKGRGTGTTRLTGPYTSSSW